MADACINLVRLFGRSIAKSLGLNKSQLSALPPVTHLETRYPIGCQPLSLLSGRPFSNVKILSYTRTKQEESSHPVGIRSQQQPPLMIINQ